MQGHIFTRHAAYSSLGWSYSCVCREHDLTINTSSDNKEYRNACKLSHRFAHDFPKASIVCLKGNEHVKRDASHRILLNPSLNRFGPGEWEFKTGSWCSRVRVDLPWLNRAEGDSDIVDVFWLVGLFYFFPLRIGAYKKEWLLEKRIYELTSKFPE